MDVWDVPRATSGRGGDLRPGDDRHSRAASSTRVARRLRLRPRSARSSTSAAARAPCWPRSWRRTRPCAASCSTSRTSSRGAEPMLRRRGRGRPLRGRRRQLLRGGARGRRRLRPARPSCTTGTTTTRSRSSRAAGARSRRTAALLVAGTGDRRRRTRRPRPSSPTSTCWSSPGGQERTREEFAAILDAARISPDGGSACRHQESVWSRRSRSSKAGLATLVKHGEQPGGGPWPRRICARPCWS